MIEQAGLGSAARRKAGGYSLGMRQRLGIAAAMLGDPPVLMFDEPFNGLDPEGIVWIRGFLRSLAAEGRAVLVSSHLMSELQDTADHLVVIGRGRLVADTSVAELLAAASGDRVDAAHHGPAEAMTVLTHAGATVAATDRDVLTVSGLAAERIVALLGQTRGAVLRGVRAPRIAGGGLHGTHPRRGRVPRRAAPERSRHDTPRPRRTGPASQAGRDGFAQLLRAEWTKFRTVRGWVIAIVAAALVIALAPVYLASTAQATTNDLRAGHAGGAAMPTGPGGEAVTDSVLLRPPAAGRKRQHHRARSRRCAAPGQRNAASGQLPGPPRAPSRGPRPGSSSRRAPAPGSPYAAIMATPGHGVRMQYDFTHDIGRSRRAPSPPHPRAGCG